ncbi:MAG: hypothetical protein ACTIOO_04340 [Pseudolactococcus laudensis]
MRCVETAKDSAHQHKKPQEKSRGLLSTDAATLSCSRHDLKDFRLL